MTREELYNILIIHRDNIKKAKSFEEFKSAQLAYLDLLIEDKRTELESLNAKIKFAEWNLTNE